MDLLIAVVLAGLSLGLVLISGYLAFLTVVAVFSRQVPPRLAGVNRRFAVLVPAHNEELLIGRLLRSLAQLDYPRELFEVCVVADNCTDGTARLARDLGARVYERTDSSKRAKGFALRWLIERLFEQPRVYDAFVVFDADSIVSANFLRSMNARLEAGSHVIQAYYSVLNVSESKFAGMRHAALAALHYLRPRARSALGLSCGLKGNGMCFAMSIIEQFPWQWYSLAEDVEFHLALVSAGVRVDFAPEATVLADMPVNLSQATSQNQRWEGGRLELLRHAVPRLLIRAIKGRNLMQLDAAAEQVIPPLSVPFVLAGTSLVLALLFNLQLIAALAGASLFVQVVYLIIALALVRAPLAAYVALSGAPVYIVWKLLLYTRLALSPRGGLSWVRTAR